MPEGQVFWQEWFIFTRCSNWNKGHKNKDKYKLKRLFLSWKFQQMPFSYFHTMDFKTVELKVRNPKNIVFVFNESLSTIKELEMVDNGRKTKN